MRRSPISKVIKDELGQLEYKSGISFNKTEPEMLHKSE